MISKKSYKCTFPNCSRSFESEKGLFWHVQRDASHNPNLTFTKYKFNTSGNKRHSIPYESSNFAESGKEKKNSVGLNTSMSIF